MLRQKSGRKAADYAAKSEEHRRTNAGDRHSRQAFQEHESAHVDD